MKMITRVGWLGRLGVQQASSGSDAELKSWAQQKLPTIKEHLARAQELANGKAAAGAKHEHN